MYVTKPYKLIWFGDIHGPKPYKITGFGAQVGAKLVVAKWGAEAGFGGAVRLLRPLLWTRTQKPLHKAPAPRLPHRGSCYAGGENGEGGGLL